METKKQKSWFITDDNIKFENSFKFWFALQWQNKYIQGFTLGFILTILELIKFGWVIDTVVVNFDIGGKFGGIATILGLSIPFLVALVTAYKGFWQFWIDIKSGNSR